MAVFTHILLATDFQPSASRAFELATQMAARDQARLTLLNVYSSPVLVPSAEGSVLLETEVELRNYAQRALEQLVERARARGIGVDGVLRHGDAKGEIIRATKELGVDLVVMGTHGNSGLARVLLGSVAEHVVRHSVVPVMTVRTADA